jgi:hypothetical protein
MEEKIIHYDSPEAAQFKTGISGWVSSDGRFWGNDEHMARYTGCTHMLCDCGATIKRGYSSCDNCRQKVAAEKWSALPYVAWDGKAPICTYDGDHYFFTEEDLIDYLDENKLNGSDIMLVLCEALTYPKLDEEYFGCDAHEDWEAPKELTEAIDKLNAIVQKLPPHSYTVGKIRTSYSH